MDDEIEQTLFAILAENADRIDNPPEDNPVWVDDFHRAVERAAGDFALQYRRAHERPLAEDAVAHRDRLATVRAEIEALDGTPDPEVLVDINNALRDIKHPLENFGLQCMIRAGETGTLSLHEIGQRLADEADRCWNPDAAGAIEHRLDDSHSRNRDDAPPLDTLVDEAVEELRAVCNNDIPVLLDLLDDASARL